MGRLFLTITCVLTMFSLTIHPAFSMPSLATIFPYDPGSTNNDRVKSLAGSPLTSVRGESVPEETRRIPNQYIVVLDDKSSARGQDIADVAREKGAVIFHVYEYSVKGFAMKVPNSKVLAEIQGIKGVRYVEQDQVVTVSSQILPAGVDRIDADKSPSAKAGDGQGAINVDIAIIDTGIDLKHTDLYVFKHTSYVPFTKRNAGNDDNGHGTHVAGIAAAKDNGYGVVGVAPGARLWAVKVLDRFGYGSISTVIKGIDYVTKNADSIEVANLSLGCKCVSSSLNSAISASVAKGVTYVAAAGNNKEDASTFSPANHPDVIAVSAIVDTNGKCGGGGSSTSYGADDAFASFSNFGLTVDIAAPGVNIYSTYKSGSYAIMSGTSMASPHVAGAAALYLSTSPNGSPTDVRNVLLNSGTRDTHECDGAGRGYFDGDPDAFPEPLVYAGTL